MSEKVKEIVYTDNDRAIVNALRGSEGMTFAELKEATGLGDALTSGHLVGAMKKGLIAHEGDREVMRPSKGKITPFTYVDSEVHMKEDGKAANYTDNEKNVLAAAASIESPFTLADLAAAMGLEKLSSGSINGLVKKGNITKGEKIEKISYTKDTVAVYVLVNEIPA